MDLAELSLYIKKMTKFSNLQYISVLYTYSTVYNCTVLL